mmetsp:Transcript_105520/g.305191  ORF Transcript_105520/g.305191 Transcript_105520/m.305191 type:complete len:226 (+) Transcript_105520:658-1335(+)
MSSLRTRFCNCACNSFPAILFCCNRSSTDARVSKFSRMDSSTWARWSCQSSRLRFCPTPRPRAPPMPTEPTPAPPDGETKAAGAAWSVPSLSSHVRMTSCACAFSLAHCASPRSISMSNRWSWVRPSKFRMTSSFQLSPASCTSFSSPLPPELAAEETEGMSLISAAGVCRSASFFLRRDTSLLRSAMAFSYWLTCSSGRMMFCRAETRIFFARFAYFSVLSVSS